MIKRMFLGFICATIVLGVLSALAGCSSGQPAATPTAVVNAAPTQAPIGATPVQTAAPSQAPAPAAAQPAATSTSGAAKVAKVGDRVESGGVAVTVNVATKAASTDQYLMPKAGNGYITVDVTIENVSTGEAAYNSSYCTVKDADGYEYSGDIGMKETSLSSGTLAKGEKVRGTVTFEVPTSGKGFVFGYQPLVIPGGFTPIKVSLE